MYLSPSHLSVLLFVLSLSPVRLSQSWAAWQRELWLKLLNPRSSLALWAWREVRQRGVWRTPTQCFMNPPSAAACGSLSSCLTNVTGTLSHSRNIHDLAGPALSWLVPRYHTEYSEWTAEEFTIPKSSHEVIGLITSLTDEVRTINIQFWFYRAGIASYSFFFMDYFPVVQVFILKLYWGSLCCTEIIHKL